MRVVLSRYLFATLLLTGAAPVVADLDAPALYVQHCAQCHGADRLGLMGPALLPENLTRVKKKAAAKVIAEGRAATQMPALGGVLGQQAIDALVEYIYTPLPQIPAWGETQISASRKVHVEPAARASAPVHDADLMNMFIVVELGDHHASVLDGDRLEPIHRFKTQYAVHGGPKYSPDGRYVYFLSRDGWISKFDMWGLQTLVEVRAGINARNLAVSDDGRYLMVANYLPHNLVVLDANDLTPLRLIDVKDDSGKTSRVSAVYTADPRHSFVAALKDIKEVWEINYEDVPPRGFGRWMHDHRIDSGDAKSAERFPVRRIAVNDYFDDFLFSQDYVTLIGASRSGHAQVVDLDLGRVTRELDLPGMPHLASGITWDYQGRTVMVTPNLKKAAVSVIDMNSWETIKEIPTEGPGFFMRSHENSRYAWVDVFFGPNKDKVHVIDKQTLAIVKTLQPAPGKTAAHVEFDKDGRNALLSIWDMDGAVVVYDADSLEERKRLPMVKPSGKYNVHNKITRSAGTSH
ncbi:MAG: c-type cytochrome [Gammaproteobacteria bacterium]|nr:c-type cytochrome [Gammaproteobacteria bacterium]